MKPYWNSLFHCHMLPFSFRLCINFASIKNNNNDLLFCIQVVWTRLANINVNSFSRTNYCEQNWSGVYFNLCIFLVIICCSMQINYLCHNIRRKTDIKFSKINTAISPSEKKSVIDNSSYNVFSKESYNLDIFLKI